MKKRFCVLLAMIMVFCLLPMTTTAASAVWDGIAATAYAGGTGTELDPYQIATGEQLAYLAQQVNDGVTTYSGQYFVLTEDIVLNDTADWESWSETNAPANEWTPIGGANWSNIFAGTFDGDNHTISGMYVNTNGNAGLFGITMTSATTIKNLGVIDSYICSSSNYGYAGGVVGECYNTILLNCYNTGTVVGGQAGGICGIFNNSMTNCWNTGVITGSGKSGGIVAESSGGPTFQLCYNGGVVSVYDTYGHAGGISGYSYGADQIINCYNTGSIYAPTGYAGGLTGRSVQTIRNSYNLGAVTGAYYMTGQIAGDASDYNDNISFSNTYYLDDATLLVAIGEYNDVSTSPTTTTYNVNPSGTAPLTDAEMQVQSNFTGFDFTNDWTMAGDVNYPYPELRNMPVLSEPDPATPVWDGTIASIPYAGGTGTAADPYQIANGKQLAFFAQQVNAGMNYYGKYVVLTDDIVLNDTTDWQSWSDTVAPTNEWTPIGSANGSRFFDGTFDGGNHTISGMYINITSGSAGLFGAASTNSTIKNLGIIDSYIKGNDNAGAIAGQTQGHIVDCYNMGNAIGYSAGGIVGFNTGSVENCINTGTILGTTEVGGIVGYNADTASNCVNLGTVGASDYAPFSIGGLVGTNGGTVEKCYNEADVIGGVNSYGTPSQQVGGIVGGNDGGTIQDCYNIGTVTRGNGISGVNYTYAETDDISRCYNAGTLDPGRAGISGYYSGNETYCYYLNSTATIGFTGRADATGVCESLTAAEMQVQSNFVGWDFDNIWTMAGDATYLYPELRDMPTLPEPEPITLTVTTLGGAARFDKTAIRFGASISFADMAALNVGDTVDYGFSINGLKNNALAYADWAKRSAASTTVNFAGFTWTAAMEAATTTEALAAVIRATGIKVYEYDATTITFAIILNNLPTAAQDSLWVFEPYVTINATDTSLGTAKYNSINRILEDIASGTYVA